MNFSDGITIRGCMTKDNKNNSQMKIGHENNDNFRLCEKDNCNVNIFSEKRIVKRMVNPTKSDHDDNDSTNALKSDQSTQNNIPIDDSVTSISIANDTGDSGRNVQFCYRCDSLKDENCISSLNNEMISVCSNTTEEFGCYHFRSKDILLGIWDEYVVRRGCLSDLDESLKELCFSNDDSCKSCHSNGCNNQRDFAECLVAENIVPAKGKNRSKICSNYNDTCFVYVDDERIVRGCSDEFQQQSSISKEISCKNMYRTCSTPLCNNDEIIPSVIGMRCLENVLAMETIDNEETKSKELNDYNYFNNERIAALRFCFTCDSRTDNNCKSNLKSDMVMLCPISQDYLGCYHIIDGKFHYFA